MTLIYDLDISNKEKVLPQGIGMQYESSITYHSKVMASVLALCKQTQKQRNSETGQKLYAPDLSIQGYKNRVINHDEQFVTVFLFSQSEVVLLLNVE